MQSEGNASLSGQDGATTTPERQGKGNRSSSRDRLLKRPAVPDGRQRTSNVADMAAPAVKKDPGLWTNRACVAGLAFTWIAGIGAIVGGSIVQRITDTSAPPSIPHHKALAPFLRLAISFIVTGLSDIAGLIHSTSLRFNLLEEGRLEFNSNLRLFTSCSAHSRVHWWPVNVAWAWSLTSVYACGSMILLQSVYSADDSPDFISGYALIFLGFGLLGQASMATWALKVTKIPTWSTNPIYIAGLCKERGYLAALRHRTMLSIHDAQENEIHDTPILPKARQGPLITAHSQVRRILIASFIITLLGFLFFAAISIVYQVVDSPGPRWGSFSRSYTNDWSLIPNWVDTTAFLAIGTSLGHSYFSFGPWFLCKYIFTSAFIGAITLNLHIVELLVQTSRDESLWRKAASPAGMAPSKHGAMFTALTSWHTIGLFVFKGLLHWMFSLAFGLMWEGVELFIPQFLYTALLLLIFAVTATSLALYRPKGPQPATFGHLQTLVDLIDVWPRGVPGVKGDDRCGVRGEEEAGMPHQATGRDTMYWGDKGQDEDDCRRAGTSTTPLDPVVMTAHYL